MGGWGAHEWLESLSEDIHPYWGFPIQGREAACWDGRGSFRVAAHLLSCWVLFGPQGGRGGSPEKSAVVAGPRFPIYRTLGDSPVALVC